MVAELPIVTKPELPIVTKHVVFVYDFVEDVSL